MQGAATMHSGIGSVGNNVEDFHHTDPEQGAVTPTRGSIDGKTTLLEHGSVCSRKGKPLCWYGASCRKMLDSAHCSKYDHQAKPCKFGAKCRRQGRGCRYHHPGQDGQCALLNTNGNDLNCDSSIEIDEPEPARPIPFVLFVICVGALGLLVLPLIGACNAGVHEKIFYMGCLLLLPYPLLELLLLTCRRYVLRAFLEGDYSERASFRKLECLWYPEHLQLLKYMSGDVAGNNIEQYATWETNDVQQQVEYVTGGNRDGGQVTRCPDGFNLNFPGDFPSCTANVDSQGNFQGLGMPVHFDGSNIVSQGGAWSKAGYCRLDFVTKVLLLLLLIGLECIFVAVEMPPGVSAVNEHKRMPLNLVFVVDGSASIEPMMWRAQQSAGQEFTQAFKKKYGNQGDLNVGIVQFSSNVRTVQNLTSNIPDVLTAFNTMPQMFEMTRFDKGLKTCQSNLNNYAASEAFDVCVLITDGLDLSGSTTHQLQGMVNPETAIFGIFVGNGAKGKSFLQKTISCGKAESTKHKCNFYSTASDYVALAAKADEIADEITHGVDLAMCAMVTALIGIPAAVCMCLPYLLWYGSCTGITMWKRRRQSNYRSLKNGNGNGNNGNMFME